MNKPMGTGAARLEPPAPVVLVPKPAPAAPANAHRRHVWLIAGLLSLAVLVAVGTVWWLTTRGATVRYTTTTVSRGAVTRAVTATGTVNPVLTIIVGTYVSGVIQDLYCDYNTQVKNGQVCAKIDPRPYQTIVDQNARQSRRRPRRSSKRTRPASPTRSSIMTAMSGWRSTNAVSQDTLDNAKNAARSGEAQIGVDEATIQQRQAELDAAQVNLDYTNIVSPVDGTVVSRNVTMGQTVAASFQTPTLFLIATDLTKMQVDTNVSESDIGGIKDGNKASFTVEPFRSAPSTAWSCRCASRRRPSRTS